MGAQPYRWDETRAGRVIGVVSPLIGGFYFGSVVAGVTRAAARAGMRVVAVQTFAGRLAREKHHSSALPGDRGGLGVMDGIVVITEALDPVRAPSKCRTLADMSDWLQKLGPDGDKLKVYEKENQQMYETPLGKSQYPAALAFLMGTGDLASSFNLKLLDAKKMKFEGGYVLEGTPKSATPAYQKVIIYVDAATAQVRRMVILDAQGNRNTFTFENPQVNTPVAAGEFTFTPPAGTQVVRP